MALIRLNGFIFLTLLSVSTFPLAETYSAPGAQFLSNTPDDVFEQNGCLFGVDYVGIDLPENSVMLGFDLYVLNDGLESKELTFRVSNSQRPTYWQTTFSQTMEIETGHVTIPMTPDLAIPFYSHEFLNIYTDLEDNTLAVCGLRIDYMVDLIFAEGLDFP